MNKFTILGHCNTSIGIILDSLYGTYKNLDIEIINNISESENRFADMPYLHKNIKTIELHIDDWIPNRNEQFILSGMSPKVKKHIFTSFHTKYAFSSSNFMKVIHSSAVITNGVKLSNSVNISPLSVIAQYAELGHFVTINRNCSIGHHTTIDDYTSVNPGCNIGGSCKIGKNVVIGIGATVFDNIKIGDNAIIGRGAVVTKNVEANTLVYGSPAKFIKKI
ncbi:MAG TPA: hypothetical protein EYP60_08710 [bacterium (Candidatus Stahlbacteria)]|nr:hypothetical protein [Candidatus Stahlbacteria bacterium]